MANRPKKQHINKVLSSMGIIRMTDSTIEVDMQKMINAIDQEIREIYDKMQQGTIPDNKKNALQSIRKKLELDIEEATATFMLKHDVVERLEDGTKIVYLTDPDLKYMDPSCVTTPEKHIDQTSKLVNVLTALEKLEEGKEIPIPPPFDVDVSGKNAKNPVRTICILTYESNDDNVRISGKQPFTEYDRCVHSAVSSLYAAGTRIITQAIVWRAMTGKTDTEKPTAAQSAAVLESLDKMRFMRVRIDCSDEFKMRQLKVDGEPVSSCIYDDNLLHLSRVSFKTNYRKIKEPPEAAKTQQPTEKEYEVHSRKYDAFEILSEPILHRYSATIKQIISVPNKLLDIKKLNKDGTLSTHSAEYTERRTVLANYLIRRIESMRANEKGRNSQCSRCIRYKGYTRDGKYKKGIYDISKPRRKEGEKDDTNKADPSKNEARYIRDDVHLILKNWMQTGYIKGFSEYKEGKDIMGVEVDI